MKIFRFIFLPLAAAVFAAQIGAQELLKFKAEIGFAQSEDQIVAHQFLDGGKKLLLVGQKNIQLWDVENAKLIRSAAHQIPQFAPKGFLSDYVLLGLPQLFAWKPYLIAPGGEWIITVEAVGDKKLKSAVVRDLQSAKQIAALDLPNVSTDYVAFDERKNEILTVGQTDKKAAFANWNPQTFELKRTISIDDYKWHRLIKNEEKMLVGSGDTKISLNAKQGAHLTLRDVKTGAVEKEFTAANLIPDTAFQDTTLSADEKFLMSKRNDRIFVWAVDGDGTAPRFEISAANPKEDFRFVGVAAGRFIVVAVNKKLRVYDFAGGGAPTFEFASGNPKDGARFVGASRDGRFIVVRDDEKLAVVDTVHAGGARPIYEIKRTSEKERFPLVKIFGDEKLLAVGRANRSEKKPERTEFYDIETGKTAFEIPAVLSYDARFTPDEKYILSEDLGGTFVWNLREKRAFTIPLEVYAPSDDSNAAYQNQQEPSNVESVALSPNGEMILRHGGNLTSVFDMETGREIRTLFDAERVKYDKQNKIKKSGLGEAGWSPDGRYVFAFEQGGFFGKSRTINLWQTAK